MATKILLKKSVTGGASPLTSDLDQGELAINLVDRKIYTKDSGNNIKAITGAYVDASAPANPVEGDIWYDTANNLLKAHNGTGFVSAGYQNLSSLEDVTITSCQNKKITLCLIFYLSLHHNCTCGCFPEGGKISKG